MTAVLVAFDEGPGMGLGHRRRCEAVVAALAQRDVDATLVAVDADSKVRAPVVLVDSYRRRADDRDWVDAERIVAFDDLARDLNVDGVIDPGLASLPAPHTRARRVCVGAAYAVVSPMVRAATVAPFRATGARVLITTGAADEAGIGARIAGALAAMGADLDVRLVLGPWGSRVVPRHVTAFGAPAGLVDELAAADIVVTAGGVSLLEALSLGRPCVAIATAANQEANVAGAVGAGAAVGATAESAAEAAYALVHDAIRRRALAAAATALVDGRGAERVAALVTDLAASPAAGTAS